MVAIDGVSQLALREAVRGNLFLRLVAHDAVPELHHWFCPLFCDHRPGVLTPCPSRIGISAEAEIGPKCGSNDSAVAVLSSFPSPSPPPEVKSADVTT